MATPAAPRVDIPVAHGRLEGLLSEAVGAFVAVAVCHPQLEAALAGSVRWLRQ